MKVTPLVAELQGATLHPLIMVVTQALARAGYGDIRILDRRQAKQKSRYGGYDIECHTHVGRMPAKVIVKVVADDSIHKRMIDELCGVTLSSQATAGFIFATKHIATSAKAELQALSPIVRLVAFDGEQFAAFLAAQDIGLRPDGSVDQEFFRDLKQIAANIKHLTQKKFYL